jgi:hypothetical protein
VFPGPDVGNGLLRDRFLGQEQREDPSFQGLRNGSVASLGNDRNLPSGSNTSSVARACKIREVIELSDALERAPAVQ